MRLSLFVPGLCLFAVLFNTGEVRGQYSRRFVASRIYAAQAAGQAGSAPSISVSGRGEVRAKPNLIEIELETSANAELTSDAVAKYQDAKRRTLQAFSDLKMKNLEIKEGGLAINSDAARQTRFMMQNGMQTQKVKTPIEVSAPLHLRLSGVQNMTPTEMVEVVGQLLDLAKDCGALPQVDANQMVYRSDGEEDVRGALARFVLTDFNAIREQAYKLAVANARAKAERLASLNQVKLDGVIAVQEIYVSGDDDTLQAGAAGETLLASHPRIVTSRFDEVPVTVALQVSFAIAPQEPARP